MMSGWVRRRRIGYQRRYQMAGMRPRRNLKRAISGRYSPRALALLVEAECMGGGKLAVDIPSMYHRAIRCFQPQESQAQSPADLWPDSATRSGPPMVSVGPVCDILGNLRAIVLALDFLSKERKGPPGNAGSGSSRDGAHQGVADLSHGGPFGRRIPPQRPTPSSTGDVKG